MFSWMGAGRIRFFSADVRDRADGARFWHNRRRSHLRDYHHAGDAPGVRVYLWFAWRSLRSAYSADDRYRFLFGDGVADSVFSELHGASDFACFVRDRHGWRMGTRRLTGDGNIADSSARLVLWDSAAGVRVWLFAGRGCLLDRVSVLRMARSLRRGGDASGPCSVHSGARAGITRLLTAA